MAKCSRNISQWDLRMHGYHFLINISHYSVCCWHCCHRLTVDDLKLQLCLFTKLRITQTVYIELLLRMLNCRLKSEMEAVSYEWIIQIFI